MAARKQTKKSQSGLPWGAMFISFAIGAFAMFLLHLKNNASVDPVVKQQTNTPSKKSSVVEPTFDFYTLLPETEIVADSPKTIEQKTIVTAPQEQNVTDTPVEGDSYLIQVGSFKRAEDADGFRARLALLGMESKVQTVTIDNTDTWHRVQVGPIFGRLEADKLQKQLKQNGIDSLLMRAKHG